MNIALNSQTGIAFKTRNHDDSQQPCILTLFANLLIALHYHSCSLYAVTRILLIVLHFSWIFGSIRHYVYFIVWYSFILINDVNFLISGYIYGIILWNKLYVVFLLEFYLLVCGSYLLSMYLLSFIQSLRLGMFYIFEVKLLDIIERILSGLNGGSLTELVLRYKPFLICPAQPFYELSKLKNFDSLNKTIY